MNAYQLTLVNRLERFHNGSLARGLGFFLLLVGGPLTFALAGCGGTKLTPSQTVEQYSQKLTETISSSVGDEGRRAEMLAVVAQVRAVNLRFSQETTEFIESYRKLNSDYEAPRTAFEQLFGAFNTQRLRARSEAVDLHFKLAALATAEEWKPIAKAEARLYEEVIQVREERQ